MSYLKEFQKQIQLRDFSKILLLWEEWCAGDPPDSAEFCEILKALKNSDFNKQFGPYVEAALPLLESYSSKDEYYQVLKALIDLQTTNSKVLAALAKQALEERYGKDPQFSERLRLIGLRSEDQFQGAISNYELLRHLEVGNFVFHLSGFGTGEVVDVSFLREQANIEFENVAGSKQFSFTSALKSLIPLSKEHFFSRRFSDFENLEKEAKKDPNSVIKMLLRDLGPKTAGEIKDLLCEWVIPEKEWSKWWQSARAKLKKDPWIETPEQLKEPFFLRKQELSQEERLKKSIWDKTNIQDIIQSTYQFVRDFQKKQDEKLPLKEKLNSLLSDSSLRLEEKVQVFMLLDQFFEDVASQKALKEIIQETENLLDLVQAIEIVAFKKKVLSLIRELRQDWATLFLTFLHTLKYAQLKDFLFKELMAEEASKTLLENEMNALLKHPEKQPETFLWYLQKFISSKEQEDATKRAIYFESFLILYSKIEHKANAKELIKKMYTMLVGDRFAMARAFLEGVSLEFAKEILLLASKCQTLSDHDLAILRSLVEVVHPSLSNRREKKNVHVLWTTEEGYLKVQERLKEIGTVEMIENAKEIEAARALGDLRENSEFKFAQEKRSRLQSELKALSEQFQKARIITQEDIDSEIVGIGSVVEVLDPRQKFQTYTILGPWDADPERGVLSFQSKFAQSMLGLKGGDVFSFKDEEYRIQSVKSYLEKSR